MTESESAFAFLDIDDPLVAWLIYRGEMVSAASSHERALSFWAAGYLAGQADPVRRRLFEREVSLEQLRQREHTDAVSRLSGFYVFPDAASAARASQKWGGGFRPELRAEVGLQPDARTSKHDAQWISYELDSASDDWMPRYLAGEPYKDSPIWELLVDGRALVYGTALRKAAYETVKRTWPDSLGLLELARLGVELSSDLGLIVGMVIGEGEQRAVRYVMNFEDARNPAFLARIESFKGQKNTEDLHPAVELVPPDLRSREFHV